MFSNTRMLHAVPHHHTFDNKEQQDLAITLFFCWPASSMHWSSTSIPPFSDIERHISSCGNTEQKMVKFCNGSLQLYRLLCNSSCCFINIKLRQMARVRWWLSAALKSSISFKFELNPKLASVNPHRSYLFLVKWRWSFFLKKKVNCGKAYIDSDWL